MSLRLRERIIAEKSVMMLDPPGHSVVVVATDKTQQQSIRSTPGKERGLLTAPIPRSARTHTLLAYRCAMAEAGAGAGAGAGARGLQQHAAAAAQAEAKAAPADLNLKSLLDVMQERFAREGGRESVTRLLYVGAASCAGCEFAM